MPRPSRLHFRRLLFLLPAAWLSLAACTQTEPLLVEDTRYFDGDMPADFAGFWARDYGRGDNIDDVWRYAQYMLARRSERGDYNGTVLPQVKASRLEPLARLVELITRTDELTISQSEFEILVEREDDFSLLCAFFDGIAKPVENAFGKETCGWNGKELVSVHELPDGVRVIHRFRTSEDRQQLRVTTTATSKSAPMPITLRHYYWRVEKPPGKYECIETLSMKRVCSTGELSF